MAADKTNHASVALQLNAATTIQTQVDNAHPLLPGLAGIGGVLLTAMLYTTLVNVPPPAPTGSASSLHTLFQFDDPRYLLAAAIFGLTPNLIIKSLQQR